MRSVVVALVLAGIFMGLAPAQAKSERPQEAPGEGARVGAPAPDFTLKNRQGEQVTLSDYRGKVVFLNFWATWCPPCRAEMPAMERLYEALGNRDFVMLAVNAEADGPKVVPGFLKGNPHSFPILFDTEAEVQQRYGVYRFPETFIIDKQGVIVDKILGARDWSSVESLKYFTSLTNE